VVWLKAAMRRYPTQGPSAGQVTVFSLLLVVVAVFVVDGVPEVSLLLSLASLLSVAGGCVLPTEAACR
jgi:uncharacterized membrane protein YoaK (UPF0700 family)